MLLAKGRHVTVTKGWLTSFLKRHPDITVRKGEKITKARMQATDRKTIDAYFDLLEKTLEDNNLMNKPAQIFNCDESGFPLFSEPGKVLTSKYRKHPYVATAGTKKQITVMGCVSAAGYALPPYVIFDRKRFPSEWAIGEVSGTSYGLSPSGWINSNLFQQWFEKHFLLYIPAARPVLLLLDGHASHYNPFVIERAVAEQIIIFCFPPNTTHLVQPLDSSCFAALKRAWNDEVIRYTSHYYGQVVSRSIFSGLFAHAWHKAMNFYSIKASFKNTGVHPLNRHQIVLPGEEVILARHESSIRFLPIATPQSK